MSSGLEYVNWNFKVFCFIGEGLIGPYPSLFIGAKMLFYATVSVPILFTTYVLGCRYT